MEHWTPEFKAMAELIKKQLLDNIEANLVKIRDDDRSLGEHTVRAVMTVLIESALPKWREPWTDEEWNK